MANVSVDIRHASILITRIARSLINLKALKYIGLEVANEARNNAYSRPGRSFWRKVGNSVSMQVSGKGVIVGAAHEAAAQKQFGGTISAPGQGPGAVGAKELTIPLGKARLNRWDVDKAKMRFNLFLVKSNGKRLLFGSPLRTGRRRRNQNTMQPLFLLKKSVNQQPDPWFPEGVQLEKAVTRGIEDYRRITGGP